MKRAAIVIASALAGALAVKMPWSGTSDAVANTQRMTHMQLSWTDHRCFERVGWQIQSTEDLTRPLVDWPTNGFVPNDPASSAMSFPITNGGENMKAFIAIRINRERGTDPTNAVWKE